MIQSIAKKCLLPGNERSTCKQLTTLREVHWREITLKRYRTDYRNFFSSAPPSVEDDRSRGGDMSVQGRSSCFSYYGFGRTTFFSINP